MSEGTALPGSVNLHFSAAPSSLTGAQSSVFSSRKASIARSKWLKPPKPLHLKSKRSQMTLTSIGRSPFLLIAIIRESLADTMRGIAWLINLTQLTKLEMQDEAPLGFWRSTNETAKFYP